MDMCGIGRDRLKFTALMSDNSNSDSLATEKTSVDTLRKQVVMVARGGRPQEGGCVKGLGTRLRFYRHARGARMHIER